MQAVLHPTAPLFSSQQQTLKPLCIAALKRIFLMCDKDKVSNDLFALQQMSARLKGVVERHYLLTAD